MTVNGGYGYYAQYLRWDVTQTNGSQPGASEFLFYTGMAPAPANTTLLADPTILASALAFNPQWLAEKVLDENQATDYRSDGLGTDTYIDFDFGAPTLITHINYTDRRTGSSQGTIADLATGTNTQAFNLIFSADTTFGDAGDQTVPVNSPNCCGTDTVVINGGSGYTARYVRWDVTKTDAQLTGAAEFDFYVTNAPPVPSLTINDVSVSEGTGSASFTLTLSASSATTVSVDVATANGTATAAADYTSVAATVQFTSGQTQQTLVVPIVGDALVEPSETFYVNLSGPVNATIADTQGVGTITNDDTAGITVSPTSGLFTTEGAGTAQFVIALTSQPAADVTIGLSSFDTTEGALATGAVTFTNANWNTAQNVTVTGVNDPDADGDINYTVVTAAASSTDPNYSARAVADVSLTNADDETSQGGGQILLTPPPAPYQTSGILMRTTASYPNISAKLGWSNGAFSVFSAADLPLLRVQNDGKVGIGTTNPTKTLHVEGDSFVSGTVSGGNIQAHYQDLAEWVPSTEDLAPGTVVVLDMARTNAVVESTFAYDTAIAGVVSAQPGILLGERGPMKEAVATTGRVRVKVDASRAPIAIGDLLVTSDRPGVAMKSIPLTQGDISFHRPGTLIGKALEPLASGEGEILVLLSLQ